MGTIQSTRSKSVPSKVDPYKNVDTRIVQVAFGNEQDAEVGYRMLRGHVAVIRSTLDMFKDHLFDTFKAVSEDGKAYDVTLADVLSGEAKDRDAKGLALAGPDGSATDAKVFKYSATQNLVKFMNSCPVEGVGRTELEKIIVDGFSRAYGCDSSEILPYVIYQYYVLASTYTTISTFLNRKLLKVKKGSGREEQTWKLCVIGATEGLDADTARQVRHSLLVLGPHPFKYRNGLKMNTGKREVLDAFPDPEAMKGRGYVVVNDLVMERYGKAIALLEKATLDSFPVRVNGGAQLGASKALCADPVKDPDGKPYGYDLRSVPDGYVRSLCSDDEEYARLGGGYYNVAIDLTGAPMPFRDGKKQYKLRLYARVKSGHSGYYDDVVSAENMALTFKLADWATPADLLCSARREKGRASLMASLSRRTDKVDFDFEAAGPLDPGKGLGIDVNTAVYAMNTTIRPGEVPGMLDFDALLARYVRENPQARKVAGNKDVQRIMSRLDDPDRTLGVLPLVFVGENAYVDKNRTLVIRDDLFSHIASWAVSLERPDGTKELTYMQRDYILAVKRLRRKVREYGKVCHDLKEFQSMYEAGEKNDGLFADTEQARALREERRTIERTISKLHEQVVQLGLVRPVRDSGRYSYASMEDVNLQGIETTSRFPSLYVAFRDGLGKNEAVSKFNAHIGGDRVHVELKEGCDGDFLEGWSSQYWSVASVSGTGRERVVRFDKTQDGRKVELVSSFEYYVKTSLHLSTLKEMVSRQFALDSIPVKLVDPKRTSLTCHVCGNAKDNYRSGRTFKCARCHAELHADENAAFNILYRTARVASLEALREEGAAKPEGDQ